MGVTFWIWLGILVVSFLVRTFRQQKPKDISPTEGRFEPEEPERKPMSFEDLLREIQQSKNPQPQPQRKLETISAPPIKPYVAPQSYDVDYDDDIEAEEKDLETVTINDARSYDAYEKAKEEAFTRPSLEETMKLKDTVVKFSHFKGYESENAKSPLADYLKDLKDPEGFRKAFILSEILNRKF